MPEQMIDQLIVGSLLGDGYITKKCVFGFNHSTKQREYFEHKVTQFQKAGYKINISEERTSGNMIGNRKIPPGDKLNARTTKIHQWKVLRNLWYPNGKKIVPTSIEITPTALAYWYMDDGSANMRAKHVSWVNGHRYQYECEPYINQIRLYTDGFDWASQEFLEHQLEKLGIVGKHYSRPTGQKFLIIAQKESRERFKELVLPIIQCIPSMLYKIDRPLQSHFERLSEGASLKDGGCDSPILQEK